MEFSNKTRLYEVLRAGEFAAFRDYIIAPRGQKDVLKFMTIGGYRRFYTKDPVGSVVGALNEMRIMSAKGTLTYTSFDKPDVGLYAFLVGEGRPWVLILPGGGYAEVCSMAEGYVTALRFNALGYNAFIGNYSVRRRAEKPSPQDDVATFVNYIISNADRLGVSAEGYAVCGFSAGGHLAASWGLKEVGYANYNLPKPAAIILSYPVITMGEYTHRVTRKLLLAKDVNNEEMRRKYSVEQSADGDYPPTFAWHCLNDNAVPFKNSEMLIAKLKECGVRSELLGIEGNVHGWGAAIGTPAEGWIEKAIRFWQNEE